MAELLILVLPMSCGKIQDHHGQPIFLDWEISSLLNGFWKERSRPYWEFSRSGNVNTTINLVRMLRSWLDRMRRRALQVIRLKDRWKIFNSQKKDSRSGLPLVNFSFLVLHRCSARSSG